MRTQKFMIVNSLIIISCIGVFILFSGCIYFNPNPSGPPVASGHVYLDGKAVSNATVDAVVLDGTGHLSTITDVAGTYTLNLTSNTSYNVTATYQGLRHTVWPVYLGGKSDTYDIYLTVTPKSTFKGFGYPIADVQHKASNMSNFDINLKPTTGNATAISKTLNPDGTFSLEVEPDVSYTTAGTVIGMTKPAIAFISYHNYPTEMQPNPQSPEITVGSNETVLLDVAYVIP